MPYEVKVSAACPIDKRYGVWKDGQLLGCHPSEDNAGDQVKALYASERVERAKYDGIDFTPPEGAREEAQRGLDWRKEFGRGGTPVGWARARDIANGEDLSPDTINRMVSYFARHEVDKQGEGWSPGEKGFPSAGRIAWALWGGDAGKAWAGKVKRQMDSRDNVERIAQVETIQRQFGIVRDGKAVIATETPIEIYDQQRGWIKQVLLMDGAVFRNGKKQLPIVDSHNDKTVRNVFGSIRGITIEDGQMIGSAEFATDDESQVVATRYAEGHLNDFSIDAVILERQLVPQGQTYTTSLGQVIEGPAEIVTKWEPHNASICATGADPNSTVRRSMDREGVTRMDESLMAKLRMLGLPEGMTDAAEIIAWMAEKMPEPSVEVELMAGEDKKPEEVAERAEHTDDEMKIEKMEDEVKAEVERQLKAEKVRRSTILNHCKLARLERSFADELIEDESVTVAIAQERIIRKMASNPVGGAVEGSDVRVTENGIDRFFDAVRDGLIIRSHRGARLSRESEAHKNKDAHDFKSMGLNRMAELVLRQKGINTDRMNPVDIAKIAMGNSDALRRHEKLIQRSAYHTTGSFPNLLLDSINKTLLAAYEEAPYTWEVWARQAPSVQDFKQINRTRFSEAPDPEQVPERAEYKEKAMSDSKESYRVEKYGEMFTISWETVVNDDLDAISRVPAMHGNACRRKVNKEVYAVLTANALMGDGNALFSASHASGSNLSGASASPSVTTLNAAFAAMRTQKGLSPDSIVSVIPRYLIVPAALEATALELVSSTSYIVANGNSGVQNLYGQGGSRQLNVVCDPNLDGNSATAWYLSADPSQIDTVEVSFLQGEESPVLESDWNFRRDVYEYKVRQTFGVKAIDWRGLYKYATA